MSAPNTPQDNSDPVESGMLARLICEILADKKGMDPLVLDVSGLTSIADYFVIVTGSSPPHLKAMYEDVQVNLKGRGIPCFRRAGDPAGNWMVLDYVDVVVHIFAAEARSFYALEELWAGAERVPMLESTPAGGD